MKKPLLSVGTKEMILDILGFLFGSISYALSVALFSAPHNIAPGGVTGFATLINYLLPMLPIGILTMVINVPLLIASRVRLGRKFMVRTLIGIGLSSVLTDLFTELGLEKLVQTQDMILVCAFGGALMGFGIGLIFARGGTTGGTDIVARLMELRWPHIPIGTLCAIVDAFSIILSVFVYGKVENGMYAVIYCLVSSAIINLVVYGGQTGKVAMILSAKQEELTARIMGELERGVTLLDAHGAYSGTAQKMILCAVGRDEVFELKRLTFSVDPEAFFMMVSSDEVLGYGWKKP